MKASTLRRYIHHLAPALLAIFVGPSVVAAQRPVEPADTYADVGARALIEYGMANRKERADGLGSFEATFRERIYAGFGSESFRRERALFHQERAARVRWASEGEHIVRWLGVRRSVPIAGQGLEFEEDPSDDDVFDLDFDALDPASDQVPLGADWALHPLADTAYLHYRYRTGDTLRIRFPNAAETITLVETLVEPRERRFDLISGSLWFDAETGVLARAAYRPAIEFDFEREEPEDAAEVPFFVKPIRAEVRFVTIDYALQDLRWWLPNRMAFDATARVSDVAEMPVRYEWTFEDYEIDTATDLDPGQDLPEGWARWIEVEEDSLEFRDDPLTAQNDSLPQFVRRVVMVRPPEDQLISAPEIPPPLFSAGVEAFSGDEIDLVMDRLNAAAVPGTELLPFRLDPGSWRHFRYNRVEGLSVATEFTWETGRDASFLVRPRLALSNWWPGLEVEWWRKTSWGRFGITAYRRLTETLDWNDPFAVSNSLASLLVGHDIGLYYRETGTSLSLATDGTRVRLHASLFAERHADAPKTTDFSARGLFDSWKFDDNLVAEPGDLVGVDFNLVAFTGVDPEEAMLSTQVWGEVATGDFGPFGRAAASAALIVPLGEWNVAVEGGGGRVFGDPPEQRRRYLLGGPRTIRGFSPGDVAGEAFAFGRWEVGRGFGSSTPGYGVGGSLVRVVAFQDMAWAGPRAEFDSEDWVTTVGVGVSLLDGLLRLDVARVLRGEGGWELHVYADALM